MKLRRQYYVAGRIAAAIIMAIYSMRGLFVKNAKKIDIAEIDIFPEIKFIDEQEREEESRTVRIEQEEKVDALPAGAKGLLLYRNASLMKQRQEAISKHEQRVREIEKSVK